MDPKGLNLIINNQYRIIDKLGEGGMGVVHLVEDMQKDNLLFAIKTIKQSIIDSFKSSGIASLKNEYEIMTRLKHPNLTQVYEFGEDRGNYYIVMEYLDGILMSDYISNSPPDKSKSIDLMVQILRVLEYIHSRNIIYRDIKPKNIMLVNGNIKLMDFGLSAIDKIETDMIQGTVLYMPPDVFSGKTGNYTDIFSLGLVFFELITGIRFLMPDKTNMESILKILKSFQDFESFKKDRLLLIEDRNLREIIDCMTAYDPYDRYRTCSAIIEDINKKCSLFYEYETNETKESYVLGNAFANRNKELSILKKNIFAPDRWDHIVYNGPVGVGKTRLFYEFKKYCDLNNISFFMNNCMQGDIRVYYSISEILKRMISYSSEKIMREYGSYLRFLLPEASILKTCDPIDIKNDPKAIRDLIIQNISDYILDFSNEHKKPVLICFNDLQWMDEGSAEIIKALLIKLKVSKEKNIPLIIYSNLNEYKLQNQYIFDLLEMDNTAKYEILPFDREAVDEYIENIFGIDYIHKSIRDSISDIKERVGGNPLFLEELIKSLIDKDIIFKDKEYWKLNKPIHEADIPDDLLDILHQRIEKLLLDDNKRKILHILSLLRIDLSFEAIKHIISKVSKADMAYTLLDLEKHEILQAINTKDGIHYIFNSSIIKEIIRDSAENKVELRLLLAETLESRQEQTTDYIEEIAYQYLQGGNIKKSLNYYIKCGDLSQSLYFHNKAVQYYDIVLEIAENKDDIIDISLKKAVSLEIIGKLNDAVSTLESLIEIANNKQAGNIYSLLGKFLLTRGDIESAKDAFDKCYDISKKENIEILYRDALLNLGDFHASQSQYKTALNFYNTYKDICLINDYRRGYFNVMNSMGSVYYNLSQYEEAIKHYKIAIEISKEVKDKRKNANAIGNMGNVYKQLSEYGKALECFITFKKISEEIGDIRGVGIAAGNMGIIYKVRGEYDKALKYYELYSRISREIGFKKGIGIAAGNMGNVYNALFKFEDALKCFEIQKKIAKEINDKRQMGSAIANMGILYNNQGDYEKALEYYGSFERICIENGDKMGSAIIYYMSGNLHYEIGQYHKALNYIDRAIIKFLELKIKDSNYIESLLSKSRILLKLKNTEEALELNNKALKKAEEQNIENIILNCKIQRAKIESLKDRKAGIKSLKKLLNSAFDDLDKANIYYELSIIDPDANNVNNAIDLYTALYEDHPNYLYIKRVKELKNI